MLGVPNRRVVDESNDTAYSISRIMAGCRRKLMHLCDNHCDNNYQDLLLYCLRSDNRYRLGDSVSIRSNNFVVMQKSLTFEQGMIQETYILGKEKGFAASEYYDKAIAGLELEGKVLERHKHSLRVLLNVDAKRNNTVGAWFRYSPATNNGMYIMRENV